VGGTHKFAHGKYRENSTVVPGIPRYLFVNLL